MGSDDACLHSPCGRDHPAARHRHSADAGFPIREADVHHGVVALREQLLSASSPESDLVVAHELALAYGRPDVVAAAVELRQWRRWRKLEIEPCTAPIPLSVALALSMLGGKATFEELVDTTGEHGSRSRLRSVPRDPSRPWLVALPGRRVCSPTGARRGATEREWRRGEAEQLAAGCPTGTELGSLCRCRVARVSRRLPASRAPDSTIAAVWSDRRRGWSSPDY